MIDPRYKFTVTVSAHILLVNDDNKVLMAKRPDTWEWGPGRWGIPGGKTYEHENLFETIRRKTNQELGFEVIPENLYKIKQLIIKDKQAFMFFFVSKYDGKKLSGEMQEYKWFGKDEIKYTSVTQFAEYFFKDMLAEFLGGKVELFPVSTMESLNYMNLSENNDYKKWFNGMIKKDFDPDKIPDYVKWKEKVKN